MASLSIIIVNWNTRDLLNKCLRSVYDSIRDLEFDVWVVDNASTDGSLVMLREQFPEVHLVENSENLGFVRANNQALKQVQTEYILLLNSDAMLTAGVVEKLLECANIHIDAGVCGAMLINPDASFQASYGNFPTLWSEFLQLFSIWVLLGNNTYPSHPLVKSQVEKEVDWVGGACLLIRRMALDDVGFLDESYEMYGEELDWCRRMWRAGWKVIYCPAARVIHHGGQSTQSVPLWKMQRIYKSKVWYFKKYKGNFVSFFLTVMIRISCVLKAGFSLLEKAINPSSSKLKDWHLYWKIVRMKF